NIKEEGFNFSPRFECEFFPKYKKNADGKEVLEENCKLDIKRKYDYVNIFPDNINVTAIVGENGSGKSSILELILHNTCDLASSDEFKYFCIYIDTNGISYVKNYLGADVLHEITELKEYPVYLHYDNSRSKIKFHNRIRSLCPRISLFPEKEELFKNELQNEELKNILLLMKENFSNKKLYKYFYPNQIVINFGNSIEVEKKDINKRNEQNTYSYYIKKFIYESYKDFEHKFNLKQNFEIPLMEEGFSNFKTVFEKLDTIKITQISTYQQLIKFKKLIEKREEFIKLLQLKNDEIINHVTYMHSNFYDGELKKTWEANNKFFIEKECLTDYSIELLLDLPDCFELNIYDTNTNISYNDLSNGEKSLLNIRLYFERVILKEPEKNYIILIDEAETDLHPQWQKTIIQYLLKCFKEYKIHFIFSSHSPFILSDLPKENVIFLKKDEDGNCKNVTKETNIETFGANIHTLLSHGFFMSGGLMGEFAKEKIDLAITYLNKKKPSTEEIDYCENIIPIIGEPIIKRQLQRMLDSKRLSKIDKIDALEDELELIKHRIESIRKNQ
ncbi:MAG: ABC-type multidrug transport system ATPase subunit, partial [Arcobacteraceae bacterium]